MRIEKTRSTQASRASGKSSAGGDGAAFSQALGGSTAATPVSTTGGTLGVGSVAALMALQGAEDPLERRRKAERRGRQLLEGLDRLKIDLLEGGNAGPTLARLKDALESERAQSDDQELESIIDQIELRVEVELAKLETAQRRSNL
ncbi:flagellar assembly protein FliX [Ponticaulis koreensis]|uniref:flagellar assembly protein FliX n=1 Tax=Ponticaulis koreensis TaxID=1123045 RepID=UPI0003B665C2|nr:flagellar assembly protein FliX [Ponticaulis koreensis]